MLKRSWSVLAVVWMVAGCAAKLNLEKAVDKTLPPPVGTAADFIKEGDEHWQKRDSRAEIEAAIAAWEKAALIEPGNADALSKLTHGVYLLADGYLSFGTSGEGKYASFDGDDDGKAKYLAMHEQGIAWGQKAVMAANAAAKTRIEGGATVDDVAELLDRAAVPALYWYTSNLGKWANAQGFATVLKYKSKIKRNIERCLVLDENYFYSAPHRYLGVIYAKAPAIAGGDMGEAKKHFDASLANSPNYLATRVLWAEFYAVKAEDKDGFRRELEYVLNAADSVIPEVTAESKIEKKKAKNLLAQIEDKF